MSTSESKTCFNNHLIIKIETDENGHNSREWKLCNEKKLFGAIIRPRRIESYGQVYTDFDKFHEEQKNVYLNEGGHIIVKPSVIVHYLGGWHNRIEKFFDSYEEARKYSQKMMTKEKTTWTNSED